jgi:hypothetical protein
MSASDAYAEAAAALQTARLQVEEDMVAAKEAFKGDRSNPEKRARHKKAREALQQVRAMERQGRPTQVAGDVFPTPPDELIIDHGSDNGPGPEPTVYGRTLADFEQPEADDNGESA